MAVNMVDMVAAVVSLAVALANNVVMAMAVAVALGTQ